MPARLEGGARRLHQLVGDPDEEEAAHQAQEGNAQEHAHDAHEGEAEDDRAHRTPDLAEEALPSRQRAHGERDHHRIVTGEQEIQEADLGAADPELRVRQKHLHAGRTAQVSRGDAAGTDRPGAGATTA